MDSSIGLAQGLAPLGGLRPHLATTSTASSIQQVAKQVAKWPVSEQAICSDQIVEEVDKIVQVLYQLGKVSAVVVAATVVAAV